MFFHLFNLHWPVLLFWFRIVVLMCLILFLQPRNLRLQKHILFLRQRTVFYLYMYIFSVCRSICLVRYTVLSYDYLQQFCHLVDRNHRHLTTSHFYCYKCISWSIFHLFLHKSLLFLRHKLIRIFLRG